MSHDLKQDVVDADLAHEAAWKVLHGYLSMREAAVMNGPESEKVHFRRAAFDAFDIMMERKDELLAARMRLNGIDPVTRKPIS